MSTELPSRAAPDSLPPREHAALIALESASMRLGWPAPPEKIHLDTLAGALAALPTQFAFVPPQSDFDQWLAVSAVAEQRALHDTARKILDGVRQAIQRAESSVVAAEPSLEWRAICWTRRGRIARTLGSHDDAQECYAEARRLVRHQPWLDAKPLAELGLAALAAARGNYPVVRRHSAVVLGQRPLVPIAHRFGAHLMMALYHRKRGQLIDALLHGWSAIDLVSPDDVRARDVMISLSEIAIDLGDLAAAEAGFTSVLRQENSTRLRVAALVGAVACCLPQSPGLVRSRLGEYETLLASLLQLPLAPRDRCRCLIALAEISRYRGELAVAVEFAEHARIVAGQFGLFDQQFRVDTLVSDLTSRNLEEDSSTTGQQTPLSSAVASDNVRHPALSRLIGNGVR